MTDDKTVDRDRLVEERRRAFETKPKGKRSRVFIGIVMGGAFIALSVVVLAPASVETRARGRRPSTRAFGAADGACAVARARRGRVTATARARFLSLFDG